MAILNTIKDFMLYLKESTGYVLYRLSAKCVAMDNGNDLQTEINTINNNLNEYIKFVSYNDGTARTIGSHKELNCGSVVFPTYDGYTLLGCVGGHGNGEVGLLVSGNKWVFNASATSKTYTSVNWYLLYVKTT